jgi:simple sugar transport system ATP-binding protein
MSEPILQLRNIQKHFGMVIALAGVNFAVHEGEVHGLLGDNGAGKSSLIKTMAGVHQPSSGQILLDGREVSLANARDAIDSGIATVFQDLAMIPMMSVTRNFFLGREPKIRLGPFRFFRLCNYRSDRHGGADTDGHRAEGT